MRWAAADSDTEHRFFVYINTGLYVIQHLLSKCYEALNVLWGEEMMRK